MSVYPWTKEPIRSSHVQQTTSRTSIPTIELCNYLSYSPSLVDLYCLLSLFLLFSVTHPIKIFCYLCYTSGIYLQTETKVNLVIINISVFLSILSYKITCVVAESCINVVVDNNSINFVKFHCNAFYREWKTLRLTITTKYSPHPRGPRPIPYPNIILL